MKRLSLCISIVIGFSSQAIAQDGPTDVFSVISSFSNALYRTGELSGGSEAEWTSLEEAAASEMVVALQYLEADGPTLNDRRRTPLHEASAQGFYFLVETMLSDENVRSWINSVDENGLTAYEHAQLAMPETMMACHPEMENPFVVIPFLVKLPYYDHREPFPDIHKTLVEAGANTSTRSAKELWLSVCSQTEPTLRNKVEESLDLYATLAEVSLVVGKEKQLRELEEKVQLLQKASQMMPASTRPSPDELKEHIQKMYRDEGFEPPQD